MAFVADVVMVMHLLCVIVILGGGIMLGLLPQALGRVLDPEPRLRVWGAIIERYRPFALGAVAGLFVTGFLNLGFLAHRPGMLLLAKIFLALGVAGHVMAQVRGAGQRLIEANAADTPDTEVLIRSERSLRRLAMSQAALVAVILLLSRYL